MILNNNNPGYNPDQYDDEPSDYVNSDTAYSTGIAEDDDDLDDEEIAEDEDPEVDYDKDETDVGEDDPINDDVSDYPQTDPAAQHADKKPVYIKDMPYIDHATPGVTSH